MIEQNLTDQGILQITFNRPEKLNALSGEMMLALEKILLQGKNDPQVKVLLITGKGNAFCAGTDINRLAELDGISGKAFAELGQRVFRLLETLGKVSLVAVNGFAIGGGCELSMAGSLRIAAESAKFSQPEVKLGVIPGYGGTQRLARLVGKGRALEACLTGRMIPATEALQWGLVSEVVLADDLIDRGMEILGTILQMGSQAITSTLFSIDQGFDMSLDEGLALEALHFGLCCGTEEKNEGVNAFIEKRKPVF